MADTYIQDKVFEKEDFTSQSLNGAGSHFEDCQFNQCNFSEADLKELRFFDCSFMDCNLSVAKIEQAVFQDVRFKGCKLLGLHFENCNNFGFAVRFTECLLNHSSFYGMKIPKTSFIQCEMKGVDFTQSDLTGAIFERSNLLDSKFIQTNLTKADFSTAQNYSIDPEQNRIQKAQFSLDGLPGLLVKYKIQVTA